MVGRFAKMRDLAEDPPQNSAIDMRPSTYDRVASTPPGTPGLWSTASDYTPFPQMLLNKGELGATGTRREKTVELMAEPPAVRHRHTRPSLGALPERAMAWGVSVVVDPAAEAKLPSPGAFGWTGAATTRFMVDPQEELVAIFMAQKWLYDSCLLKQSQTLVY
jgi:CubicO group peptidase (beta-lactamase class C family)